MRSVFQLVSLMLKTTSLNSNIPAVEATMGLVYYNISIFTPYTGSQFQNIIHRLDSKSSFRSVLQASS